MMRPWIRKSIEKVLRARVFNFERHTFASQESSKEGVFDVLLVPDWVNVIAETADKKIILIRQFRAGTGELTWEIPGGALDPGEVDHLKAAQRELLEETGYSSQNWKKLGHLEPNPAFLNNQCVLFHAKNCQWIKNQNLDPLEEIEVKAFTREEVLSMLDNGKIRHALVVAAFYYYLRLKENL